MTSSNQSKSRGSFDPSRDIDDYLVDDAKALRDRGLQKQSIRFYELLCRLCLPGETQLVYRLQDDLISDLMRLAPGEGGLSAGRVSEKFKTLVEYEFVAKSGGGQSGCPLVVDFLPPDQAKQKPPRPRRPTVVITPAEERQGQFFDGGGPFRVVHADEDEQPKPKTFSVSKAQAFSVSAAESENVFGSAPEHTFYTRVCGVESIVEDESTETSSKEISEEELLEAKHAWRLTVAKWRARGITHRIVGGGGEKNVKAFLKAHVLLQRGQLSESIYAAAAAAPLLAETIKKGPFALVWTEWKRDPQFFKKIACLRVPSNWAEGIRRSDSFPTGEQPQQE